VATFTTLYLFNASPGVVPNANLSAADYKATNSDGSNAKNLQTTAGTGGAFSANVTLTTIANATSKRGMVAQHASMPLSAQTIAAGNWTVGFVGRYQYFASATKVWKGWAALYLVNGLTGAIRTTIFAVSDIGSTGRTGIAALTCYAASVAGASAVVTAGDYLVLEWGVTATNNSGATASNQIVSGAYGPQPKSAATRIAAPLQTGRRASPTPARTRP
jgi:hypothetical protein